MNLKNIKTLTKSELAGYLVSPAAYVFVIIFLVLSGFLTFMVSNFFKNGDASLNLFFYWHPWLYLILVPAVGMHMWSDEKRLGTNELLFTLPVTHSECILAKFIAAWVVIGTALALTFPIVITVCKLGNPDEWAIACGYFGSFLLGGAYLSIAGFTSSLTKSQVVSFIISVVVCFFLILAGWPQVTNMLVDWAPRELLDTVASFSVWPYFHNMQRGVIDTRDILYFLSIIGYGLFLTSLSLKRQPGTILTSIGGAVVIGLIIILINALTGTMNYRLDFTENKIYTLSAASKKIIGRLDRPVTIKFYCSRSNNRMPIVLKNFSDRVEDLLTEYKEATDGQIYIEKYDPKPFSDAEDSAIMDGITGQPVENGEKIYLGIAVTCGKEVASIPFLSPAKENMLEYEITRSITEVTRTKKPVIGVMSVLPVLGGTPSEAMMQKGIFTMLKPWQFVKQLKKDYTLKKVRMDTDDIDKDINLLLIFHPAGISERTQFAIDQFILRGGKAVIYVDPSSFIAKNYAKNDPSLKGKSTSNLPELFKAWGITYTPGAAVADSVFGRRIRMQGKEANYLAVVDITKQGINRKNVITAQLDRISLYFAGAIFCNPPPGLKAEPLLHSTKDSSLVSALIASDPHASFRKFKSDNKEYPLALEITGLFTTAFPDKAPQPNYINKKQITEPYLKKSLKPSAVIVTGDVDFLYDEFCVQPQNVLNTKMMVRINDNLNFVQNAVDALAGDSDMIGIRCRPTAFRPFEKVKQIEAKAEEKFKEKILELEKELSATQERLNKLQKEKKSSSEQMILSPAQQDELSKFRQQQIKVRKELKQLQKEYRSEIDQLEIAVKWLNILAVPFCVVMFGIILGIIRKVRSAAR